jgi:hypothetical protein
MNPHRPRKPRRDGAAIRYLDQWRQYVVRSERVARKGAPVPGVSPYCECCGVLIDDDARSRLESLMHHGGRRAHKLRVAVELLDERFRAATVEADRRWRSESWWKRREVEWDW